MQEPLNPPGKGGGFAAATPPKGPRSLPFRGSGEASARGLAWNRCLRETESKYKLAIALTGLTDKVARSSFSLFWLLSNFKNTNVGSIPAPSRFSWTSVQLATTFLWDPPSLHVSPQRRGVAPRTPSSRTWWAQQT